MLAAAAALAEWPDRIRSIFLEDSYPADGQFKLKMYYKGEQHIVEVDDLFPVDKRNRLLNS